MGIGVVGLTTALKLQQQGTYQVTIVSEVLPSDPKTIRYTSRWAVRSAALSYFGQWSLTSTTQLGQGAHHVYNAINETNQHRQYPLVNSLGVDYGCSAHTP